MLLILLILCFVTTTAFGRDNGGYLGFVDGVYFSHTVRSGDDEYGRVYYGNGDFTTFPFGCSCAGLDIYISNNGYFSLNGVPPYHSLDPFPLRDDNWIVAPFAADIDTTRYGSVRYTDAVFDYDPLISVENFINEETGNQAFDASAMIVAEWDSVPHLNSPDETNTFQGIIITDQYITYAVFIYDCSNMEWGGGVIGWQSNSTNYQSSSLSGESDNNRIGCLYSYESSAIAFLISDCDQNVYFACDNRNCVGKLQVCDGHNDCGDNSDEEQDCGNNPRLIPIIGYTVGAVFFVIIWLTISICIFVVVIIYNKNRRRRITNMRRAPAAPASSQVSIQSTDSQTAPLLGADHTEDVNTSPVPSPTTNQRNLPHVLVNPVSGDNPTMNQYVSVNSAVGDQPPVNQYNLPQVSVNPAVGNQPPVNQYNPPQVLVNPVSGGSPAVSQA